MTLTQFLDDLAAGDEVRALGAGIEGIQTQLESLGATPAPRPIGHILVPRTGAGLALPAGTAQIDFGKGTVKHQDLGTVTDDLLTISEITDASPRQPQLNNLIFHSDTVAQVEIGDRGQEIYLQSIPIPEPDFQVVEFTLEFPGEITLLASTERLPISVSAITLNGQRHGEHADAVTDTFEAVPVAPFDLWDAHGTTHANSTVYTAFFDTCTWTVDNTGAANDLQAEIQAIESLTSSSAEWRTIASDTIPNGDHSVFNVSERHKYMRARVTNDTLGQSIGASVDLTGANP